MGVNNSLAERFVKPKVSRLTVRNGWKVGK